MKQFFLFFGIFAGMNETILSVRGVVGTIEMQRVKLSLSIEEICKAADVTPQYYRLLRAGKAPNVAASVLFRLLKAVDVCILLYKNI